MKRNACMMMGMCMCRMGMRTLRCAPNSEPFSAPMA